VKKFKGLKIERKLSFCLPLMLNPALSLVT